MAEEPDGQLAVVREAATDAAAPALAEQTGPLVYRCASSELFIKRSREPDAGKIVKIKKAVGSRIFSTGTTWTGPSGGKWAQLDARRGDGGWILVEGPGFGLNGPALLDATEGNSLKVQVFLLGGMEKEQQGVIWESMVQRQATVLEIKKAMCKKTGLTPSMCVLSKDKPCMNGVPGNSHDQRLPVDFMPELKDDRVLATCGFEGETATLMLIYVGDMPEGVVIRRKPLPEMRDAAQARALGV